MALIANFEQALEIEDQKKIKDFEEQMSLPISDRIAKGITMANLQVSFGFHRGTPEWCSSPPQGHSYINLVKVYSKSNISKFREGGTVVLCKGGMKLPMRITEDTVNNFILEPDGFQIKECCVPNSIDDKNWEINISHQSITKKLLSATALYLNGNSVKLNKIEELLDGNAANGLIDDAKYTQLNPSQNSATEQAINTNLFHLIQGPPGTGKTKTIAHIAKELVKKGKNIFITGPTHTAINNCLNAISEEINGECQIIKIGEKYQAKEILDNPKIIRKTRLPLDKNPQYQNVKGIIIGGTPYSLCYDASKRLRYWEFDVAIIDEAAQMSIPLALAVMARTHKYILVGDHKQLDPIIPSNTGNPLFSKSIFKKLVDQYPSEKSLLNISYRLNDDLIRIPNKLFYESKLSSKSIHQQAELSCTHYPELLNHPSSKLLYSHNEFDGNVRSVYEANMVAKLVEDLKSNNISPKEIGIVTPYRAQVRELKKAVHNQIKDSEFMDAVLIDTVDRIQGQERDYIFYSLGNTNPLGSKRRLEFFYSPNRLNVAITRAKKKCIVLANYKVFDIMEEELMHLPNYKFIKDHLEVFQNYYKLATVIEAENKNDISSIFN